MPEEPTLDLVPWLGEPDSLVVTADTGDRLHYLDWGSGRDEKRPLLPPLVLVHGLGATAWTWTPVARRLRSLTHVVALDLLGHGLSDSPRSGYDLESLAYDALTVMSANRWGSDISGPPAVVAGHGLGAMVAATMAQLRRDSIAGLALVDGGWEDLGESTGMTAAEYERSIGDPPEVLASMTAYLSDRREFDPQTWDTDQERAARAAVDEKHAGHVVPVVRPFALRATVDAMFSYRPEATLADLPMPILVAVAEAGTADDETAAERSAALDDIVRIRSAAGVGPTDETTDVQVTYLWDSHSGPFVEYAIGGEDTCPQGDADTSPSQIDKTYVYDNEYRRKSDDLWLNPASGDIEIHLSGSVVFCYQQILFRFWTHSSIPTSGCN